MMRDALIFPEATQGGALSIAHTSPTSARGKVFRPDLKVLYPHWCIRVQLSFILQHQFHNNKVKMAFLKFAKKILSLIQKNKSLKRTFESIVLSIVMHAVFQLFKVWNLQITITVV